MLLNTVICFINGGLEYSYINGRVVRTEGSPQLCFLNLNILLFNTNSRFIIWLLAQLKTIICLYRYHLATNRHRQLSLHPSCMAQETFGW